MVCASTGITRQAVYSEVGEIVVNSAKNAAFGFLGAVCFTKLDPVAGALFGAVHYLVMHISRRLFRSFLPMTGPVGTIVFEVVNLAVSFAITAGIMHLAGFAISIQMILVLFVASLVAEYSLCLIQRLVRPCC